MGFALLFSLFSLLFLEAGWTCIASGRAILFLPGIFLFYLAATDFFDALLYLGASVFRYNPGWGFKDHKGRVRKAARLLSGPYLFFEARTWRRYRARGEEPLFEKVRDGLFLGARITDKDVEALRAAGIGAVLDLTAEFDAPRTIADSGEIVYLCIPVLDGTAPSDRDLDHAIRFITDGVSSGRPVLVHCTFGHGRSALAAAASLIAMGDAGSPEQALGTLRRLQRKIWLSREQTRALHRFCARNQGG